MDEDPNENGLDQPNDEGPGLANPRDSISAPPPPPPPLPPPPRVPPGLEMPSVMHLQRERPIPTTTSDATGRVSHQTLIGIDQVKAMNPRYPPAPARPPPPLLPNSPLGDQLVVPSYPSPIWTPISLSPITASPPCSPAPSNMPPRQMQRNQGRCLVPPSVGIPDQRQGPRPTAQRPNVALNRQPQRLEVGLSPPTPESQPKPPPRSQLRTSTPIRRNVAPSPLLSQSRPSDRYSPPPSQPSGIRKLFQKFRWSSNGETPGPVGQQVQHTRAVAGGGAAGGSGEAADGPNHRPKPRNCPGDVSIQCLYIDADKITEPEKAQDEEDKESSAGEARDVDASVPSEVLSRSAIAIPSIDIAELGCFQRKVKYTKQEISTFLDLITPLVTFVTDMRSMLRTCGAYHKLVTEAQQKTVEEFLATNRELNSALARIAAAKARRKNIQREMKHRIREMAKAGQAQLRRMERQVEVADQDLYRMVLRTRASNSVKKTQAAVQELEKRMKTTQVAAALLQSQVNYLRHKRKRYVARPDGCGFDFEEAGETSDKESEDQDYERVCWPGCGPGVESWNRAMHENFTNEMLMYSSQGAPRRAAGATGHFNPGFSMAPNPRPTAPVPMGLPAGLIFPRISCLQPSVFSPSDSSATRRVDDQPASADASGSGYNVVQVEIHDNSACPTTPAKRAAPWPPMSDDEDSPVGGGPKRSKKKAGRGIFPRKKKKRSRSSIRRELEEVQVPVPEETGSSELFRFNEAGPESGGGSEELVVVVGDEFEAEDQIRQTAETLLEALLGIEDSESPPDQSDDNGAVG